MTFVVHYLSCYPYKIVGVVIKVLSPLLYCWDTSWILYLVAVTLVYCMNMIVGGGIARDLRSWLLGRAMLSDGTLYVIICVHGLGECLICLEILVGSRFFVHWYYFHEVYLSYMLSMCRCILLCSWIFIWCCWYL